MPSNQRIRVDLQVTGLREISRRLRHEELLAFAWRDATRTIAAMLGREWGAAIPVWSGRGRASIRTRIQKALIPRYVLVKATATRSSRKYKRYRYVNRQEYDPRSRNRGRLTAAFMRVLGAAQGVLDSAARQIEAKWRS